MKAAPTKATPAQQPAITSFFDQQKGEGQHLDNQEQKNDPFFPVQTKLSIGSPNDQYEREADATADKVIKDISENKKGNTESTSDNTPAQIQRKCAACEAREKEEGKETPEVQLKPIFESDADPNVQMKCPSCGKEHDVQQKSDQNSTEGTTDIQNQLNESKGKGSRLPEDTRTTMEDSIGADFSNVNIHTDTAAENMNQDLGAHAFTHGSDIYFNRGQYNPNTESGQHLLAHELTHTVQQGAAINKKEKQTNSDETPDIQKFSWFQSAKDKANDACKDDKNKKGSKDKAKSKETGKSDKKCKESNPSGQKPPKGQKEPSGDEPRASIGANAGASAGDRQNNAPPTKDGQPQVPTDATTNAQDQALGPCDKKNADTTTAPGTKAPQGNKEKKTQLPGADQKDKEEKKEKGGKAKKGEKKKKNKKKEGEGKLNASGLGEMASPALLAERALAQGRSANAMASLVGVRGGLANLGGRLLFVMPTLDPGVDPGIFAEELKRHGESSAIANNFVEKSSAKLSGFIDSTLDKANQIQADTIARKAMIQAKILQKKAVTKATISRLKNAAIAKAQTSLASVNAKHAQTLIQIETKAMISRMQVMSKHLIKTQLLDSKRTAELALLDTTYTTAHGEIKNIGITHGAEAQKKANNRAKKYEQGDGLTGKTYRRAVGKEKDGFWDGWLTYNRYQARAKSARETGKQYKEGMVEQSAKQADKLLCHKPDDIQKVNAVSDQSLENMQCVLDNTMEAIEMHRASSLEQANQIHAQTTVAILEAKLATLNQLSTQESAQLQFLNDFGIRQSMAVERDAQTAMATLLEGSAQAATQLLQTLQSFREMVISSAAPNPKDLLTAMAQIDAQFMSSIARITLATQQAFGASQKGIGDGEGQTHAALEQYSQSELQSSQQTKATFDAKLTTLVAQVLLNYDQLLQGFNTQVDNSLNSAKTTFDAILTGLDTVFNNTINQTLTKRIEDNKKNIIKGMRDSIDKDLDNKVTCQAEAAAKEVQPWWKKVLKVLLVIVVIVVMIVVLGPAGGLLATVIQGAIAGAVAGAVIQIGNNLIDGKTWYEGVGKAAIIGAIGGAFGGLGGHFAQVLVKGGQAGLTASQHILRGGVELAFDVVGGIVGDLAVGNPITLEGILLGAAIGAGVQIGMGGLGGLKNMVGGKNAVDAPNVSGGSKPDVDVNAPKVDTPGGSKVPDTNAPKTGDGTAPKTGDSNAPKAGDADAPKSNSNSPKRKDGVDDSTDLQSTRNKNKLNDDEFDLEMGGVQARRPGKNIDEEIDGIRYTEEVELPNGHKWRKRKKDGGWCRFSERDCFPAGKGKGNDGNKTTSDSDSKPWQAKGPDDNPSVGWGKGNIPCFKQDTLVSIEDGVIPIQNVKKGMLVKAYDFKSGEVVLRKVYDTFNGKTKCWIVLNIGQSVLFATEYHPIWEVSKNTWIDAGDLKVGMNVSKMDGTIVKINEVNRLELAEYELTYNLSVEGVNNFFACRESILVHNDDKTRLTRKGFRNYKLMDASGKVYYHGLFGPGETIADVKYRHANNHNRFKPDLENPKLGDQMIVDKGTRTYAEARRLEHERVVKEGTWIGGDGENYRGNRQYPMGEKSFPRYYTADAC